MELELAKSLSKFDTCVDSDYLETKNKEDQNELKNSVKVRNSPIVIHRDVLVLTNELKET